MNLRTTIFLQIAIFMIFASPVIAQFDGAVWEVLTSDSLQHTLGQNPIAATLSGFHLTYAKSRGPGNGWAIYYRFLNYYGSWDSPVTVESSIQAFEPSISAGEFGAYKIGIFYDSGGDIYGDVVSSPWDPWDPVNLTNSVDDDRSVTSAINMEGVMHLCWVTDLGGYYKIAYGELENDSFTMEIIQGSELGEFGSGAAPFIAVVDSVPHIFYRGVNSGSYHIHHAFRISPDSLWQIEFLYTPNAADYAASAAVDPAGDLHLANSGNDGWGMPGHIYYLKRSHQTGDWSSPELVSGQYSMVDGHIGITDEGVVFVAGAGVSGNIYTGDIYLSDNSAGTFEPEFLANYPDGICPAIAFLPGPVGVLVMCGRISHPGYENEEIIYYGPQQTRVEITPEITKSTILSMNYPNPFNSGTSIQVNGVNGDDIVLGVYDLLGKKIAVLRPSGTKGSELIFRWNGNDGKGDSCPSGTYYYSISKGNLRLNGKMTYLK